jgi:hypothetical protein
LVYSRTSEIPSHRIKCNLVNQQFILIPFDIVGYKTTTEYFPRSIEIFFRLALPHTTVDYKFYDDLVYFLDELPKPFLNACGNQIFLVALQPKHSENLPNSEIFGEMLNHTSIQEESKRFAIK